MKHPQDILWMQRALDLAIRGQGSVEPNPMVGCVVVRDGEIIGEGWHQRYGGPHAEIHALHAAGPRAQGSCVYVTLEPCSHYGKTPPCTEALIASGVHRVVVAMSDPFPAVSGRGLTQLQQAGIIVECGLLEDQARRINGPYLKLLQQGRPWIMAKWAMSLDGKIATASGDSRWISGEQSRAVVHQLRGRVDGIMVGSRTAQVDNPQLTARPSGRRQASRVVFDRLARLASDSHLAQTAGQVSVLVAVGEEAAFEDRLRLGDCGCEVIVCPGQSYAEQLGSLLDELGRRRWTNLLVEGGGGLLGGLFELGEINEVHVFVAPKLIGGSQAVSPLGGLGAKTIAEAWSIQELAFEKLGEDLYLHGFSRAFQRDV